MSPFEAITILLSIAALILGIWNFQKLSDIDSREEYKNKNRLVHEVLDDALALIEKIVIDCKEINDGRLDLIATGSSYNNSSGADQGHNSVVSEVRLCFEIKSRIENLCDELKLLANADDKPAFDRCFEIRSEIKEFRVKVITSTGKAMTTVKDMKNIINSQSKGLA